MLRLLILFLCISFISCKDDNDGGNNNSTYFMSFKVDGTLVSYSNQFSLNATLGQSGAQYLNTITGADDATSNMGLQIFDDAPLTVKSYSGYTIVGGLTKGVIVGYLDPVSGLVFSSGGGPVMDAIITITEITATTVSGSFSGTLQDAGQPDKLVTEGQFIVRKI